MSAVKPPCCPICGLYFTTHVYFHGRRCLQPGHWLTAGLLSPADYVPLSQLIALAAAERARHPLTQGDRCEPIRS